MFPQGFSVEIDFVNPQQEEDVGVTTADAAAVVAAAQQQQQQQQQEEAGGARRKSKQKSSGSLSTSAKPKGKDDTPAPLTAQASTVSQVRPCVC